MIGTTTAQPSTQAILNYSYQYRSMTLVTGGAGGSTPPARAEGGAYADGAARTDGAGRGAGARGARTPAELLQAPPFGYGPEADGLDRVELGNRRGLLPGTDTILAILEEKVNVRVEASFAETEAAPAERPDYWSAEATGERIARFALKFYDRYAEKHGESEEALEDFLKYVTGAIDEGFGQARKEIANVSGGQEPEGAKSLVDATYDKVMSVLEEFRQSVLERLNGSQETAGSGTGEGTGSVEAGTQAA